MGICMLQPNHTCLLFTPLLSSLIIQLACLKPSQPTLLNIQWQASILQSVLLLLLLLWYASVVTISIWLLLVANYCYAHTVWQPCSVLLRGVNQKKVSTVQQGDQCLVLIEHQIMTKMTLMNHRMLTVHVLLYFIVSCRPSPKQPYPQASPAKRNVLIPTLKRSASRASGELIAMTSLDNSHCKGWTTVKFPWVTNGCWYVLFIILYHILPAKVIKS